MPKLSTPLEIKLFDALKRIAAYDPPERIIRRASKDWGLDDPAEALEYAYDNVLHEAKQATKGVRVRRPS